jgi:large subunit ribosomal protein L22
MTYAHDTDPRKSARACGRGLSISASSTAVLCRSVTGMRLEKAKALLQDLLDQRRSLSGKYYTKAAGEVLNIVKSAESNAESKGLDTDKLHVHVSAHQGFTFYRPRGWKRRREKRKSTNLQVVLEAR